MSLFRVDENVSDSTIQKDKTKTLANSVIVGTHFLSVLSLLLLVEQFFTAIQGARIMVGYEGYLIFKVFGKFPWTNLALKIIYLE